MQQHGLGRAVRAARRETSSRGHPLSASLRLAQGTV
jgi:hypothetical protein